MKENIWNFAVRFIGRMASICVAVALLFAWAITGPLFYMSDLLQERFNKKEKNVDRAQAPV